MWVLQMRPGFSKYMSRFCLLIHTFREFRHKNFQETQTIIGGLDWRLTVLTTPFCNQSSSARQISLKYESPPILTTIWSPTEFSIPPTKLTSCFEAKYLAMTQALSPGCNPEKTEHRLVRNGSCCFFRTQTLNDYMVYFVECNNVGINIPCIEHLGNGCSSFFPGIFP